jgi:hypothetical protein
VLSTLLFIELFLWIPPASSAFGDVASAGDVGVHLSGLSRIFSRWPTARLS